MKVLHLISGGETGGSKNHLLSLLQQFNNEEVVLGIFQKGEFYREAKALGLPTQLFEQKNRYDVSIIFRMKNYIKKNNFSILHTHGPRANTFGLILKKLCPDIQWVTTVHSDPKQDFIKGGIKGKVFTAINLKVLDNIDHYFAVSDRFKVMLTELGIDKEKITTIYNGISFEEPTTNKVDRKELQLKDEDFVISMIARLHPIKGHEVVLNSMKGLLDEGHRNVHLLLVGEGPQRADIEAQLYNLDLGEYVHVLGFRKDVHAILELSDVKLLASFSESFPLVILEAARARVPVISTDVGGVQDLISSKELGWIIPVNDENALNVALTEAIELKEQNRLKGIGENLYHTARENYSLNQLFEATYNTYEKLIN
ncbi:glycosyltransferase [Alkalihalobacillus sp. AL-G]|uniref:glycosyltransferase n=1 Tax=Alkalihalobacillus sp. AL-G TaxID=2926399 RepID=UPI00272B55FE|nr:glycosyltransferase [Alkalihalobacillus sp. AL-G]WLD92988.1 glycosyltransferase [Alkalihalobacillus sp. AL-G]